MFYYILLYRKKDFRRLHRKKSPAVDITINLLVNFHLTVLLKVLRDNLYISWVARSGSSKHLDSSVSFTCAAQTASRRLVFHMFLLPPVLSLL